MTGVVNIPLPVMRFIAVCELLGIVGLVLPYATGIRPVLTPLAAVGLGVIMVPAARIHLGLNEARTALGNLVMAFGLRLRRTVGVFTARTGLVISNCPATASSKAKDSA